KFIFLPDKKLKQQSSHKKNKKNIFFPEIMNEINRRRNKHAQYIQKYRKESEEEWFELWPSSMNRNIANIYANRRLFKSYEPFLSNEIVKIAASIPQKWKLNRLFFNILAKPFLKESKFTLHSDVWLPYYSYKINSVLSFFTWTYIQV